MGKSVSLTGDGEKGEREAFLSASGGQRSFFFHSPRLPPFGLELTAEREGAVFLFSLVRLSEVVS